MKNFKVIALVLFSVCFTANTYSQGNFSIHFGPAFPVSDFASDDLEDDGAGGAAVGILLILVDQVAIPLMKLTSDKPRMI